MPDDSGHLGTLMAEAVVGLPEHAAAAPLPYGVPGTGRLCAFSDGVFAIAITLLVLSLQVPANLPASGLIAALPGLLPKLAGHVITFAVLGIYWVGHHNMFLHIRRHDRALLWLNNLFLLFISAMPFWTGLIAQYGDDRIALIAYAVNLVLAGLSLDLIWIYATRRSHRLVAPTVDRHLNYFVHRRVLAAPACYLVAIGVCFVSITAAKAIFFLVAVAYILPDPMDRFHHRQFHRPPGGEESV